MSGRRAEMARAALDVASERGLAGVTLAAVAERCGVVPSALYRHFPGREGLGLAMLEEAEKRIENQRRLATEAHGSALDRLGLLLEGLAGEVAATPALAELLFADPAARADGEHRRRQLAVLRGLIGEVADLLRRAQAEGEARWDISPGRAATCLVSSQAGPALLASITAGEFDPLAQARFAWSLLLPGLRKQHAD
ncbi:TetR/AcrR family transcriptional regulator [Desulfohalovibrio reitneri]|uniref:TetR/AcrR family transcriptional regulator n=1 Tax=Desulfohalovibrio reitneri TaxID=1307759 RepID=UPI0004A76382|nr:TetR/AcrR family transcriptional regulator [Desulfohalovibrio reitneri]